MTFKTEVGMIHRFEKEKSVSALSVAFKAVLLPFRSPTMALHLQGGMILPFRYRGARNGQWNRVRMALLAVQTGVKITPHTMEGVIPKRGNSLYPVKAF
jgi:hypothetical protein